MYSFWILVNSSSGEVGGVLHTNEAASELLSLLLVPPPMILLVSDVNDDTSPLVTDADDS